MRTIAFPRRMTKRQAIALRRAYDALVVAALLERRFGVPSNARTYAAAARDLIPAFCERMTATDYAHREVGRFMARLERGPRRKRKRRKARA